MTDWPAIVEQHGPHVWRTAYRILSDYDEAEKIVAWWYPKEDKVDEGANLDTAHVLYGDLRIETMPVDILPSADAE